MIRVYYGEFLKSPAPLELAFNYCSHGCRYCFANLNVPDRTFDARRTARFLAEYQQRYTLEAELLKAGYPVLISNLTDPFAASNYQQALPVMEALTALGVPLTLQTRGGRGVDETLSFLPPSVWYVSICQLDDARRARLEPGAPPIGERFDLIERLRARGHRVVLGFTPLVPEWLGATPDEQLETARELLRRTRACGAEGVWFGLLHFSDWKQVARLDERDQAALTPELIARARRRRPPDEWLDFYFAASDIAWELGFEVFNGKIYEPSDFFQPWRDLYPRTFPTYQDLVNLCFDAQPDEETALVITFEDFLAAMEGLPAGLFPLDHYIGSVNHDLLREERLPRRMSYTDLLRWIWNHDATKLNPPRATGGLFAYAVESDLALVTNRGDRVLLFTGDLFDSLFAEMPETYLPLAEALERSEITIGG